MPYTTPAAQSSGAVAPSSWAATVKAALDYLANPPACRVYHNANQTIATTSNVALAFNSERFDTDSMHSTSSLTSRITFNTAGLYLVTGQMVWVAAAAGNRQAGIRLNGTTFIGVVLEPAAGGDTPALVVSTLYKFAVGDYVELMAFQNSGGNLDVQVNANYSPEFSAVWVGLG